MKKFENPMINILMFDASVAMGDSAIAKATEAIGGKFESGATVTIDTVDWGTDSDWTF